MRRNKFSDNDILWASDVVCLFAKNHQYTTFLESFNPPDKKNIKFWLHDIQQDKLARCEVIGMVWGHLVESNIDFNGDKLWITQHWTTRFQKSRTLCHVVVDFNIEKSKYLENED